MVSLDFMLQENSELACPMGSEAFVDEDDGQTEGSFGRMIAKVYCQEGSVVLNAALLQMDRAEIDPEFCSVSEFSRESWARATCANS